MTYDEDLSRERDDDRYAAAYDLIRATRAQDREAQTEASRELLSLCDGDAIRAGAVLMAAWDVELSNLSRKIGG